MCVPCLEFDLREFILDIKKILCYSPAMLKKDLCIRYFITRPATSVNSRVTQHNTPQHNT